MSDPADPEEPRRYHHGDLRAALMQAAEAELAERGVEGFSLRSVAKRAGVSHAAPAHHFGDVTGLLTALAAEGFRQFVEAQEARQAEAAREPGARLEAAALGYVDFACARPALFRLIFSSARPDFADPALQRAAEAAFDHLVADVRAATGRDPSADPAAMEDVAAVWAGAHGVADLLASGRLKMLPQAPGPERDRAIRAIVGRMLPL